LVRHAVFEQIRTHRNQVRAPYSKLQEVENDEAELKRFVFHNN